MEPARLWIGGRGVGQELSPLKAKGRIDIKLFEFWPIYGVSKLWGHGGQNYVYSMLYVQEIPGRRGMAAPFRFTGGTCQPHLLPDMLG